MILVTVSSNNSWIIGMFHLTNKLFTCRFCHSLTNNSDTSISCKTLSHIKNEHNKIMHLLYMPFVIFTSPHVSWKLRSDITCILKVGYSLLLCKADIMGDNLHTSKLVVHDHSTYVHVSKWKMQEINSA